MFLADANGRWGNRLVTRWSPAGDSILYAGDDGLRLMSPDGKSTRLLTSRKLIAYNFSRNGAEVFGILQNTSGNGPEWQLYAVSVKTGADRFVAALDLPSSTANLAGFSVHPDGKRALTSVARFPFHIWMLEGFEPPEPAGLLSRVWHRLNVFGGRQRP